MNGGNTKQQSEPNYQPSTSTSTSIPVPISGSVAAGEEKWGTHVMGTPAVPTCHPNNQKAATWDAGDQPQNHHPYVQHTPVQKPANSPMESVLRKFNSWSTKAETTAHNIWHNRKSSISNQIFYISYY